MSKVSSRTLYPERAQDHLRAPSRSRRGSPIREESGWLSLTVVASIVQMVWVYELWRMHPRVPLTSGGDASQTMGIFKNLITHGWYYETDRLGAPFGQNLRDFPAAGDSLHLLFAKVVGLFTKDPALIINIAFMATYPLIAAAAYVACRLVGLRPPYSVVVALLYVGLPYHVARGVPHLFLATYYVVPLLCALAIRQCGPRPLLRRRDGARWRGWLHRDAVIGGVIVVLASVCGLYYAFFGALFLVLAAGIALLRRRYRAAVTSGLAVCVIAVLLGCQLLPSLAYSRSNGSNPVAHRTATDVEYYPLRLTTMLLPIEDHRLELVRNWRDDLEAPLIRSERSEALGLVGAVGFMLVLFIAAVNLTRVRALAWSRRVADVPLLVIGGVLLSTYYAFDQLFAFFGLTQIRAWNRISVFLAFFCLIVVAFGAQRALRGRPGRRVAPLLAVAAVLGIVDQTAVHAAPRYEEAALHWANDRAFYRQVEEQLDREAAVFQLPIADFPESPPIGAMTDYTQIAGYLHTETLRWSYGGVKGREADWRLRLSPEQPTFVEDLLITGFTGLVVNTNAYPDRGAAVDQQLRALGAVPSVESPNGDATFYDVRPARPALDAEMSTEQQDNRRRELLTQPHVRFGDGFYRPENAGFTPGRWMEDESDFTLFDEVPSTGAAVLQMRMRSFAPGSWSVTVTAQGRRVTAPISDQYVILEMPLDLRGEPITIDIESDAPEDQLADQRKLVLHMLGLPTIVRTAA